jgi:hypothetical protein
LLIQANEEFALDADQLARLEKRAKLGRFLPSFAVGCFNGVSTRESPVVCTNGDGGDDEFRLNIMDNDLVRKD